MSEKTPKSNPAEELLNQFDDNKAQNQVDEYWKEQLGDAGTTDFSDEARTRLEEVKKYHGHLEKLSNQEAESDEDYYNRLIADEQSFEADRLIAADPRLRWLNMMAKDIAKRRKDGGERNEAYIKDQEQKLQDLMSELADVDGIDEGVLLQIVDRTVDSSSTNETSATQPTAEVQGKSREDEDREVGETASNNVLEEEQRKAEADAAVAQEASSNVAASEEEQPSLGELVETQTTSAESAPVGENTPEAQQEGDARTQATDEVADILANDSQEASSEQEASTETPRVRGRKKMAAWVMNKFAGIKYTYAVQKRAKRVQKLKAQQRRENLIATSEQIAAEKSEDENYAPLTKKDFNFRSRHGIGKRAKERDPIYEEAARRLDGVAENEDEIQTEPSTNIDGGVAESHMDTQRTEVIDTARLPAAPTAGEVLSQKREQNPDQNYELKAETEPGDQVYLTPDEAAQIEQIDQFTYKIPGYEGQWRVVAGTEKFERLPDEENNESAA